MKKLSLPRQRKMIELFYNLFSSGFHLVEIIDFLKRSHLVAENDTKTMSEGLLAGKSFADLLADLRFSDPVVTQVSLAEIHGNTQLSLLNIQQYLTDLTKVRRKLIEVATYPLILLGFLVLIMLGLNHYLLPQLEEGNTATVILHYLPVVFLISVVVAGILAGMIILWYRKTDKIRVFQFISRLPFLGKLVQLYLTAYYAREWGSLIGQGLEMSQIVRLMQEQPSTLFREIGKELEQALSNGSSFECHIKKYQFFKRELSLIIEYGQVKSKLGRELMVYADECWETFFGRLHTKMQLIQPLVFIFVALVVVLIYAAMLLPIYQNMSI